MEQTALGANPINLNSLLPLNSGMEISDATMVTYIFVSFILGIALMKIHENFYEKSESPDISFTRSLMILTPILTLTFFVIQKSFILSFGLIGSLSFVRYRLSVKKAEDIAFVLAAIGVALGLSIQSLVPAFSIIAMLSIILASKKIMLYLAQSHDEVLLTFRSSQTFNERELVDSLKSMGLKSELIRTRNQGGMNSYLIKIQADRNEPRLNERVSENLKTFDPFADVHLMHSAGIAN